MPGTVPARGAESRSLMARLAAVEGMPIAEPPEIKKRRQLVRVFGLGLGSSSLAGVAALLALFVVHPAQEGIGNAVASAGFASVPATAIAAPPTPDEKPINFVRDVRPILVKNCFACHGPDEKQRKAKLNLDVEESARKVLANGVLKQRIETNDEDRMPPAKSPLPASPRSSFRCACCACVRRRSPRKVRMSSSRAALWRALRLPGGGRA